jgi:hypothetical protein
MSWAASASANQPVLYGVERCLLEVVRLPTISRITAPSRSWSWRTTDWAAEDHPSAL